MLKKLMKYDLIWINKFMVYFFTLSLLFACICKVTNSNLDTTVGLIIDKICSCIEISCLVSCAINCIMRVWVRFKNNIYKDESYLTHTLPVNKNQIWNSKVLSGIISLLLATIVILACIMIVYLNSTTIESLKSTFDNLIQIFGKNQTILICIGIILMVIFEILFIMLSGMFGIIVGFRCNNGKIIRSVFVGIMMYGFLSSLLLIIMYIFSRFNSVFMELYTSGLPSPTALKMLVIVSLVIYGIYNVGYYFACRKLLNKGVNVV